MFSRANPVSCSWACWLCSRARRRRRRRWRRRLGAREPIIRRIRREELVFLRLEAIKEWRRRVDRTRPSVPWRTSKGKLSTDAIIMQAFARPPSFISSSSRMDSPSGAARITKRDPNSPVPSSKKRVTDQARKAFFCAIDRLISALMRQEGKELFSRNEISDFSSGFCRRTERSLLSGAGLMAGSNVAADTDVVVAGAVCATKLPLNSRARFGLRRLWRPRRHHRRGDSSPPGRQALPPKEDSATVY